MKDSYNFSNAERGKFVVPGAEFAFPVYLDQDVDEYMSQLATRKGTDIQQLVNEWLRVNIKLVESVQ